MPRPTTRTCPRRRHTDQLLISRTELRAHTELESVLFALLDPVPTSSWVDLWNYHVSTHATVILARLRNGQYALRRRVADGQVDAFQRWVDVGKPP
jgi:hypothetical protein